MALNWPVLRQGQPAPGPLAEEPIRTLQYLLRHQGHAAVAVDGIFGPVTADAVRAFQRSKGLTADGIVGNQTWPALLVEVSRGSEGDPVRAVQSQFRARRGQGSDEEGTGLAVDGIFGPQTDAAVRAFQDAAGLNRDGIVGPRTWYALVTGVLAG